jgi:hypothetical protein
VLIDRVPHVQIQLQEDFGDALGRLYVRMRAIHIGFDGFHQEKNPTPELK